MQGIVAKSVTCRDVVLCLVNPAGRLTVNAFTGSLVFKIKPDTNQCLPPSSPTSHQQNRRVVGSSKVLEPNYFKVSVYRNTFL